MDVPVLGVLEFNSIAVGINAMDEMVKAAPVKIIEAKTVCPGKFVILITGDVASVDASLEAGKKTGAGYLIDELFIPRLHRHIIPAIVGAVECKLWDAVGVIECFSTTASIVAGDIAAKTADVVIAEVAAGSPTAEAGIQPGDRVLRVNGRDIHNTGELSYNIQLNLGRDMEMELLGAGGEEKAVELEPRWKPPEGQGATGISFAYIVSIEEVAPGSPAAEAGIQPGDTVLSANGQPVRNPDDLQDTIEQNAGKEVELELRAGDGSERTVTLVPLSEPAEGESASGIQTVSLSLPNEHEISRHYPFHEAVPKGFRVCLDTFTLFRNEIKSWLIGRTSPEVAGPIGIFEMTGDVAQLGISPLLEFAAFLSINLGIINLLPLPALDGGRIVFVLLELVRRGKRISPEKERLVHAIGLALLLALAFVVAYWDVIRIVSGESIF